MAAAKGIGCHTTLISQVLSGRAHLSLEQPYALNSHLKHPKAESEYFLLLVQAERAGTQELKSYFKTKLSELKRTKIRIKDRIAFDAEITKEDQARFYSDWLYAAIHVLTSIPGNDSVPKISRHLGIVPQRISDMVDFLLQRGLIVERGGKLQIGPNHVHLGSDSHLVHQHHRNWRTCTLSKLGHQEFEGIHYSAAVSLSKEDAALIKEKLLSELQQHLGQIKTSPPEELYSYCFDFFRL